MYTIQVRNKSGSYYIYNPVDSEMGVIDAKLTMEINKSGTLVMTIANSNPNIEQVIPLASEVYVYNDSTIEWIGRPIEVQSDFNETRTVTCEGVLGYLLDSQMPPFDYTGSNSKTIRNFIIALLNNHNSAVSKSGYTTSGLDKRFTLGSVTVADSNDNIARSSEEYESTMEIINSRLLETHGGILKARWSADGSIRYIDYVDSIGDADQPILFGENLLDLSKFAKTESLITALFPFGASDDSGNKLSLAGFTPSPAVSGISKNRADAYIWSPSAVSQYGYVYATADWDDVTLKQNLYKKAADYLKAVSIIGATIELQAIDLSRINVEYNQFKIGQMANIVSIPHDINAWYQITQMETDLLDPAGSTLVLGGDLQTFTFASTKAQKDVNERLTTEISDAVQSATELITGGLGGHVVMKRNAEGQPEEILIMNTDNIETATRVWRWNVNGLGYSSSGYDGTYGLAMTMDGKIVADFIKTGTLNADLLTAGTINANLIKAGTLSDRNGNTKFDLSTGALDIQKGSLKLGKNSDGSYNFSVTDTGVMACSKANITGGSIKFTATDGSSVAIAPRWSGGRTAGIEWNGSSGGQWITTNDMSLFSINADEDYVNIGGIDGTSYSFHADRDEVVIDDINNNSVGVNSNGIKFHSEGSTYYSRLRGRSGEIYFETDRSTVSSVPNMYINSSGALRKTTWSPSSSRQLKEDITTKYSDELDPARLYDVDVVQFRYNDTYKDLFNPDPEDNRRWDTERLGIIIEDLDEAYPIAIDKADAEDPKTWTRNDVYLVPAMLKLIQDQKKEIDELRKDVDRLMAYIKEKGGK